MGIVPIGSPGAECAPDQRALLACIARACGHDRPTFPAGPVDWEAVASFADRQGVAPLLHAGLAAAPTPPPPAVARQLHGHSLAAVLRRRAWVAPLLQQTLAVLGAAGLDPIVLKGAALADTVYPAPALRTFGDLDLLVPTGQAARAGDVLADAGYCQDADDPAPGHHLRPYYWAGGRLAIELHDRLLDEPHPYAIDLDALAARAHRVVLAGQPARVLAPPDALLLTCVHLTHAHRYRFFPLRHLVDILALTTARDAPFDWDAFGALVQQSRAAGAVYWPLWLSARWLASPIPAPLLRSLAPAAPLHRALAPMVEAATLLADRPPTGSGGVLHNVLLELSLQSGRGARAQLAAVRRGCFPAPESVGHLPARITRSRLRYLSYLVRPRRVTRGLIAIGQMLGRAAAGAHH